MTSFEAKVLLTGGETATIATYLFDTLKEKMPTDGVVQYSDWFQEINIILLTKRIEAINAEDTLGYLYTSVYNKIKDEYKKNEYMKKAIKELLALISGFDHYLNTKVFDETCWDRVLRLTEDKISKEVPEKQSLYKDLTQMILYDDRNIRKKLLGTMSHTTLFRERSEVKGLLTESVKEVVKQEGAWI